MAVAAPVAEARARATPLRTAHGVPWHIHAVLFASTSVLVGVLWDISWHQSIGRDKLLSPPHLAIYLGGIVAGLACGWIVLRTTFAGTASERAASVSFWKYFRAPLGAWVCIWGAIAMITSAPFDDWWHNAYGLDVKILSPPHAVLAAGIGAINLGAVLMVLPLQNRAADPMQQRTLSRLFLLACGLLVLMMGTIMSEYHYRVFMHGSLFYVVASTAFPVLLVAAARGGMARWPATMSALVYSGVTLIMMWVLPLFPAEPMLAPIHTRVTHMVPTSFPLLLVFPALAIDVIMRRFESTQPRTQRREWATAALIGAAFTLVLLAVQWPFATFLMSDYAQNPLFAADNFPYLVPRSTYYVRRLFLPFEGSFHFAEGIIKAVFLGTLSARAGLAWGSWMRRVER